MIDAGKYMSTYSAENTEQRASRMMSSLALYEASKNYIADADARKKVCTHIRKHARGHIIIKHVNFLPSC